MSATTLISLNLSRDVNDNHVQEGSGKTGAHKDGKHRRVQLVIPEPKRTSPTLDLSHPRSPDQSRNSPSSSPSMNQAATHLQPFPWQQMPMYHGFPPFPFFQYPTFPGYPFPVLPEHMYPQHYPVEYLKHLPNLRLFNQACFPPVSSVHATEKLPQEKETTVKSEETRNMMTTLAEDEMKNNRELISPINRVFLDKDTVSIDKKKETDSDTVKYRCDTCHKSYSTFSGLSKHKQFHCAQECKKEFACKYCDKTYVSLGALKMHIRTHTLPCKCKICGKAFSRPWLLQGHVRTHTGEKPFTCCTCLRAFADRSNLRAHLQTHSDVKKYSCSSCSKTFSRMSLLLKHEDSCRTGTV